MAAIAIALGSSALWGTADFLGGLKSRRIPVAVVLSCMYGTALATMLMVTLARGVGPPGSQAILAGLCAGLFGITALASFYRALAIGTMSIVAPIAATGVALPVIVGLAGGDRPGALRSVGLAAAVIGVVLASRENGGDASGLAAQRQSIVLALAAGLGFGMYFVLSEIASRDDVAWALLLSRASGTPLVVGFALFTLWRAAGGGGRGHRLGAREVAALAGIGLLDLGANLLFNVATTIGELSTVAVASSLYPVSTVLLAALVLGERVRGTQRTGVLVTLGGVLLIAAGA
ncbi:MAG: EamA family transporter [Solirubrobacteraceae bacterium]